MLNLQKVVHRTPNIVHQKPPYNPKHFTLMLLYCDSITPRLQYIAGFIGKEISSSGLQLVNSIEDFSNYNGIRINYSSARILAEEVWIKPQGLLTEKDIREQVIDCFAIKDVKAFFKTEGDLTFDIFSASFFLLSRYEEYLPHKKDSYGRYHHENSIAYKEGFLNQPLVNVWIGLLKEVITKKFPAAALPDPAKRSFGFIPTYDIDIAWSYLHKGWWRNAGGMIRSLLTFQWSALTERIRVLRKKEKDPYDAYSWMRQLHNDYKLKPYYFFLVADETGRYDKNISPHKKVMQDLIYDHAIHYPVGVHPSWRSGDDRFLLKTELSTLSKVTGVDVRSSRQHYLRFTLPDTFHQLIDAGIRFDFSMGYGHSNGFRASVASPFYWYDLEKERQTELLLFPFCFMEANSFYEQKYTADQALEEMRHYYKVVKAVNGTYMMIWHNSFLGTDKKFAGWRDIYEQLVKEISQKADKP
jgi:hypothetical protein